MHALVTGGTGFIGSALCRRLLQDGHTVTVLSRAPERASRQFEGRVRAVGVLSGVAGEDAPEAVVNLAGLSLGSGRWTESLKQTFVESRVGTTRKLIEYIAGAPASARPRVLVSGSAVGYYGARGDEPLDERSAPADEYQSDLCKAWEEEARRAEEYGVRVCLSRTGAVLDQGGGPLESLLPQFRWGLGGYAGSGRQWLSWIHREDLIEVFLRLIGDESLQGPFNSTAPKPETNRDFAVKLGAAMHRPVLLRAPGWAVRLLVGEMAHLYLTGQKVLPKRLLDAGFRFRYPELGAALERILGRGDI